MADPSQDRTVRPEEVARFGALAARWWDPSGPMRPLHAMNPARIGWIAQRLPHTPCRILDIGCGAGLATEALARLGHDVLGVDAAAEAIDAARAHAAAGGVNAAYRAGGAEALAAEGVRAPCVVSLEVIEHVADPEAFVRLLASLLEPGGRLFLSTLNRTVRSLAVAKLGAEYVARLLPSGTHDWRRFLTPAEMSALARGAGLRLAETAGLSFDLRHRRWTTGRDLSINYLAMLTR